MKRSTIVIRRGVHPNEASAFYLAGQVHTYLRNRGCDCVLETKPLSSTAWGEMMHGTKYPFHFRKRGTYFSFHNTPVEQLSAVVFVPCTFSGEALVGADVEIPAVYKPVTNPHVMARREQWANGHARRRTFSDDYMKEVAEVRASRGAGLLTDELVKEIAEQIIELCS